jgi:ubiquinone/menaquinone biosynthesis C-methylase UbiE
MPFYENFSTKQPTSLGASIANREANNVLKAIIKYKKKVRSVLELGPGRGPFAAACQTHHLDYACADISWGLLQGLSSVEKRVQTMVPGLPFASQSFDLSFASNLLEHMLDFNHALLFIEEMKRVTCVGGLICHRVPNAMAWGMHFWNGDYTHSFFTTPRTVSQVYLDAGLEILTIVPVSGFVVGPLARLTSILGYLTPSWMFDHGASRSSFVQKLYSFKTTFYLGFLIVGRKGG